MLFIEIALFNLTLSESFCSISFKGFCEVTNHQSCLRLRVFMAKSLIYVWPLCAGLKLPPKRPIFILFKVLKLFIFLVPYLTITSNNVLISS